MASEWFYQVMGGKSGRFRAWNCETLPNAAQSRPIRRLGKPPMVPGFRRTVCKDCSRLPHRASLREPPALRHSAARPPLTLSLLRWGLDRPDAWWHGGSRLFSDLPAPLRRRW